MKKVIFLDAGHGGIDPKTGDYTTAPSKMFKHQTGNFHNGTTFYEGVKNRDICQMLTKKLVAEGITVIPVYHEYLDNSLRSRVDIANAYHETIAEGIYISEHSNATSEHKAKGISVWTSEGQNTSDKHAQILMDLLKAANTNGWNVKLMQDISDGDGDYESNFFVLRETVMTAILLENLFFDNFQDANTLIDTTYHDKYTDILVSWIKQII